MILRVHTRHKRKLRHRASLVGELGLNDTLTPCTLLKIFLSKAGLLCHRATEPHTPQALPKVLQPCSLQVSVLCSPLSGPSPDCGRNSGSTEVAISKPPGAAHHVAWAEWKGGPKTIGAVPVPVAEPALLSLPGSAWGLRWVTGSLDLGSTPWVLLSEAGSALPTPRLGAWTAGSGWSRPQGTLLPLQPPDRARKEGGTWR